MSKAALQQSLSVIVTQWIKAGVIFSNGVYFDVSGLSMIKSDWSGVIQRIKLVDRKAL